VYHIGQLLSDLRLIAGAHAPAKPTPKKGAAGKAVPKQAPAGKAANPSGGS